MRRRALVLPEVIERDFFLAMPEDSGNPEFWETRYKRGVTPWQHDAVPLNLARYARRRTDRPRVLIPGCGTGGEVSYLVTLGWEVTAIDFSAVAVAAMRARLGAMSARLRLADFFEPLAEQPFDVVYERAFLCALPLAMRPGYAARMSELVRPGGELVGFFYFERTEHGPPFGIDPAELERLLGEAFERTENLPVNDSIAIFRGKERWQVWRRREVYERPTVAPATGADPQAF